MSFPKYPKYKDSGVEWLGEVPEHWEVRRLRQIGPLLKGCGGSKEDVVETGVPCVRYGDLYTTHAHFIRQARTCVTEERSADYFPVHRGDVLFAASGEDLAEIGRSAVVLFDERACCGGDLVVLRPDAPAVPEFMGYACDCWVAKAQKASMGRGTTVKHIYPDELKRLLLAIPALAEQTAIAIFLDRETAKIDALIAEQQRLIELLQEKRQAVISHAVTKGLNPDAPMKDSGIEWLGEVPEHWAVHKLGYAARLQGGFAFPADTFGAEGTAVVRMNNLKRGELDLGDAARIPESCCIETVALHAGDLLWGMSGSIGATGSLGNYARVGENDLPCQLNQRVGRFVANPAGLDIDYLESLIQSPTFYDQVVLAVTGTAQFNISSEQVEACLIALPPRAEQSRIAAFLLEQDTKGRTLTAQSEYAIALLQERRSALISAAVTGQIDVRGFAGSEAT